MTAPRIDLAVFDMAGTTIDEGRSGSAETYPWTELVAPARPMSELRGLLTGPPGPAPRAAARPSR
ncbi:hypothetical protein [Streptomyces rugosispiralis]|uniref:Hydrolase n=1 Tax=Streptomyces rugosispiralis TaxID=2967341 RepID=A0ABT1V462_9ACTN|nr:hypothetical protein [Streptomyces rugosispiralis]MCQ8192082.1 hypothetical protein [Streptomyces rugosispiralis]